MHSEEFVVCFGPNKVMNAFDGHNSFILIQRR